jgi:hypothetical protein
MVRIPKNSKRPATDWPEVNQSLTKGQPMTSLRRTKDQLTTKVMDDLVAGWKGRPVGS